MIAVWELTVPYFVTNPNTLSLSSCTASLGYRSPAAIINGSSTYSLSFQLLDRIRIIDGKIVSIEEGAREILGTGAGKDMPEGGAGEPGAGKIRESGADGPVATP